MDLLVLGLEPVGSTWEHDHDPSGYKKCGGIFLASWTTANIFNEEPVAWTKLLDKIIF